MLDKLGYELTIGDRVLYTYTGSSSYYMVVGTIVSFTSARVIINSRKSDEVLDRWNKDIRAAPDNLIIVTNDPRFIQGMSL